MEVAGFTGAEADELRRAMAFNRSEDKMERVTAKLRARMTERASAASRSTGSRRATPFPSR